MTRTKPARRPARSRDVLSCERLESRTPMAVDGVGAFASFDGTRAWFAPGVSHGFTLRPADFDTAADDRVLLRIDSRGGVTNALLNDLRVTGAASQTKTASGGLLVRLGHGSHTVSGRFGWAVPGAAYAIDFRLAGDVDGSYEVTPADLARIRTGIRTPAALTQQEFTQADVDGNGVIDGKDLRLAASNLWASTAVRPLVLQVGIAAGTPSHEGVVRVASGKIAATTTPGAVVVFVNAATGERERRVAGADGSAIADVAFKRSATNRIEVMARDRFGQRENRHVAVEQRPEPVVIVPGWGTSGPADLFDLPDFLLRRGYPAERLAVLGVANAFVYGKLQDALAAAGYVKGRDQFIVPYDWRLSIAPSDGVRDGVLAAVTAESILQPQPAFSLGYLGNFLKQMVVEDPSIVSIDLLGHSNGGLLSRAYVQSLAYGAPFTAGGRTYSLPKVEDLMLLATPSLGSAITYPFWSNDTSSFTLPLVLADLNIVGTILGPVYNDVVTNGASVAGPDGHIDRAAIADPLTALPDPRLFLRRYLASLRDMLPTYAFLTDTSGRLTTINNTPDANHLLLDINARSSPGRNPWTRLVREVTVGYGEHPRGGFFNQPIVTETFVRAVVADGRSGSVWPFQAPTPITPPAGSVYLVRETLPAGDDMVPSVSLRATYADDPRIVVRPWGNGTPGAGRNWTPTAGSVRHAELLGNPDVLAFIRRRLRRDPA
ncbi:MAG: dockerin type I domain-containing protein [Planctomycetia bacterium]